MIEKIVINNGSRDLIIEVVYSKRKTMGLQIRGSGGIFARVPQKTKDGIVKEFVESHRKWIISRSEQMELRRQTYRRFPAVTDEKKLAAFTNLLNRKVRYYADIMGVSYGKITVKNQKTRWGSCSSKGNLNFNCRLCEVPENVMDYVVIHELAHRRYMNHSNIFWEEVAKYMPDYQMADQFLKHAEII